MLARGRFLVVPAESVPSWCPRDFYLPLGSLILGREAETLVFKGRTAILGLGASVNLFTIGCSRFSVLIQFRGASSDRIPTGPGWLRGTGVELPADLLITVACFVFKKDRKVVVLENTDLRVALNNAEFQSIGFLSHENNE